MPTERNTKSNSTSPDINANKSPLNHRQRVSSSSTTYPLGISFLSTSTSLNESEDMAYIEKRTAHNALERQRREGLNSKFQELAHVLPSLQQVRRPSKSMIVAKSLEFVSNAVERETNFQGQLDALRLENAQLLRQANISKKRMRKQIENDNLSHATNSSKKNKKHLSHTTTSASLASTSKEPNMSKPASIVKSRRLPSKMKPQLRQSSMPISNSSATSSLITNKLSSSFSLSSIKHKVDALNSSVSNISTANRQRKRSREDNENEKEELNNQPIHSTESPTKTTQTAFTSPPTTTTVESTTKEIIVRSPPDVVVIKRRRRTTDTSINSTNMTVNSNVDYHSLIPDLNQHHYLQYNNNQQHTNPDVLEGLITPTPAARHNSITPMNPLPISFNEASSPNSNEVNDISEASAAVVPSQFDISTTSSSPFGNEHTFYNTFENLEHVVSTIPALRTPIGRNNNAASITPTGGNNQLPSYDPTTLDIFNSLMQDPSSVTNDTGYYWH